MTAQNKRTKNTEYGKKIEKKGEGHRQDHHGIIARNTEYGGKAEERGKEIGNTNSPEEMPLSESQPSYVNAQNVFTLGEIPSPENQPALPLWACELEGRLKTEALTVGEVFQMDCKGPTAELLSADLQFKDEKGKQYKLHILEVLDESENNLQLKAVSYRPGDHKFKKLFIEDQGQPVVRIESLDFKVKSVLKNSMQKPYGPVMAMKLSYPSWLWMAFVFPLVVILLGLLFWWRRKLQMLRVIERLKKHDTALGAFNQFNKDMRLLERKSVFKKK